MDGQKTNIKVDLKSAESVVCDDCGFDQFVDRYFIKKISALISPSGKEQMIPLRMYVCAKCKTLPDALNPFKEDSTKT